ncbi:MAG: VOC family protein [Deltaproteobacteria bacterium]|nr:VOC family protein [Deltaproteobacteria bacterium]
MISRIDHVSLAVRDFEKASAFFREVLGAVPGAGAEDPRMKYYWQVFSLGDLTRLELITPTEEGSFLDPFMAERKGGGVHHITLETPDIREAMKRLDSRDIPYFGYNEIGDFWKEIFIHPRHAFGVLIQVAEFRPDDWLGASVKMPEGKKWTVEKDEEGCTLTMAHPGGGTVRVRLSREEAVELGKELL